jgi:hypothetical protein
VIWYKQQSTDLFNVVIVYFLAWQITWMGYQNLALPIEAYQTKSDLLTLLETLSAKTMPSEHNRKKEETA